MSFLQRNINLFLVFLFIVMIGLVVGMSMYFETRFSNVTGTCRGVNNNLETCQVELLDAKSSLENIRGNLNSTESDIRKYDELYVQKANDLEKKTIELTNAKSALSVSEKSLTEYKARYESEKTKSDELQTQASQQAIQITALEREIDRKNDIINDLQATCQP